MKLLLSQILPLLGIEASLENDPWITSVAIDSRKVKPGALFLALQGENNHGLDHARQAIENGAVAMAYEGMGIAETSAFPIPAFGRESLRAFASPLLHVMHGQPGEKLFCVGITGTNGKTTITRLSAELLKAAQYRPIRLGTIDYAFGDKILPSPLTTPGSDQFFEMLEQGVSEGCDALAMEVSSHALSQDRIRGLKFQRVVFSNLTQDHLDFHGDMENYFAAKSRLFTAEYLAKDAQAVINLDSPYADRLIALAKGHGAGVLTFSQKGKDADLFLVSSRLELSGSALEMDFQGRKFTLTSSLVGAINLENLLAAVAIGWSLGLEDADMQAALGSVRVPGRNEVFPLPLGAFAVVDYAHTPDALERVLRSIRPLTANALHCVFGCGGDRDRGKRPLMGGIAATLADKVYLTSDNPRTEKPEDILADIAEGISNRGKVSIVADRRQAIRMALENAKAGDCVLIAGKGHEDYQIIGKTKQAFSDQAEIRAFLASTVSSGGR